MKEKKEGIEKIFEEVRVWKYLSLMKIINICLRNLVNIKFKEKYVKYYKVIL